MRDPGTGIGGRIVRRRLWFAAAALAAGIPAAFGAPADFAARRFRAAVELEKAGQLEEARRAYRQIVDMEGAEAWADDALLALARLAWPVDDPEQLADPPAGVGAATEARGYLEALRQRYPDSDAAPEGLWRLALLHLLPAPEHYDREKATALLMTLPVVYPDSPRVPDALELAARLQLAAGRTALAGKLAFRLRADWPDDPRAAGAALTLARVALAEGRAEEALVELGRARRLDRGTRVAAAALDLATLVDRIRFGTQRSEPLYRPAGWLTLPERAADLAADDDGRLYAALPRSGQVLAIEPDGGQRSVEAPGIAAVAVDAWGRLWTAGDAGVRAPGGVSFPLPDRSDPVALAPVAPGAVWVVDRRQHAVLRVEAGAGVVARAALPSRSDPVRVIGSPDGGAVILLEAKTPMIVAVAADGKPALRISLGNLARDPVDIDRDELGDIYVLDARAPQVLLLSPRGEVIARLPLPAEGEHSLARAACLAVDRSGRIAVHETRRRGLQWFQ